MAIFFLSQDVYHLHRALATLLFTRTKLSLWKELNLQYLQRKKRCLSLEGILNLNEWGDKILGGSCNCEESLLTSVLVYRNYVIWLEIGIHECM